jgi:hypothetical protein
VQVISTLRVPKSLESLMDSHLLLSHLHLVSKEVKSGAGHFYPVGAYVTCVIGGIFYFLPSRLHIVLK